MSTVGPIQPATQIPLIDVAASLGGDLSARRAVAEQIGAAARDLGFFYVTNHGVDEALIREQLAFTRRFFAMPASKKDAIGLEFSTCTRGYERLGAQVLDEASPPDLKESFLMSRDLPPSHPYVSGGVPNYGPNQWPVLEGFREQMEAYYQALAGLELAMMRALALSLALPEDYFDAMYDEPMSILRILHYPPAAAGMDERRLGAGAHTDWGMLTFLLQDEVGGLEVLRPDGVWVPATPIPGSFVVNLGDMITRMTNGLYHSTMHRVRANRADRDRYSVAFFGEPCHFAEIKVLGACVTQGDGARFSSCTVGEHLVQMQDKTYGRTPVPAA